MEPVTNERIEAAKEAAIDKAVDLFKKGKSKSIRCVALAAFNR